MYGAWITIACGFGDVLQFSSNIVGEGDAQNCGSGPAPGTVLVERAMRDGGYTDEWPS